VAAAVVDAHQHFWDTDRFHYPWLTDARAAIRRPFRADDLRPLLAANGVTHTVVIEARSSLEETRELLALAEATDFLAGVVGWVDLADPDVAAVIADLRAGPGGRHLVGIRHQVREEPDPRWLLRPEVLRGLGALAEADLAYDLLVGPAGLRVADEAAAALPGLTLMVEHLGAPDVRAGEDAAWAAGMERLAGRPNVRCKVSGLVAGSAELLAPFVRRLLDWFGDERLLFGSDWPVCLLGAGYDEILGRLRTLIADRSPEARRRILGENAVRTYRLDVT
jgi:L-fuconolactonase